MGIGACGPKAPPTNATGPRYSAEPPPPPLPPATPELEAKDWGEARSARYSLVVLLPERASWQIDDEHESWFTARHGASQSELALRTWRGSRVGKREECEAQVRLWRPTLPDPEREPETVMESRPIPVPEGYDTMLTLGARRTKGTDEIEGFAIAIGHDVGSCFAGVYRTLARGSGAEDAVAARLALIADGSLSRVRRLGVEDRVR